ncbi:peptidylprolyl isomerase [Rubellimicrobium roseum]|uniref:Parvulin-like PPIase n=1 Tax=Rubellimicrobium roseum TaxID=687525 RepID=A0A5C4NK48_9RHOB|nr:peptidylprolyl isomerase [Rubellimicrobium roseum]TNC74265.1 peptidylprolyl isomerase [Rubellimicrobium roseum]
MLKQLMLLQTASALALALALPVAAQDAATEEAPAAEDTAPVVPDGETTDAQATDAPAEGATAEAPAPATDATRDTVVASVNGTDITLGQVLVAARQLPAQYQQLPPDVLFGGVVDQLIQQELLAQQATEPSVATGIAIENQRRALLANEVLGDIAGTAVTDEAVQAAYDAQYGNVEPATEWNASHILVETEEEAQAVVERLNAGEEFAAVAQEVSTDTGSGAQGGELGWFGPGMMVPEFETGVSGLEAGQTSAPIQSQFGWHVIRLNETRPQEAPALDAVRAEIEGQLQQQAVEARLAELEAGAQVTRPEPGQFDPAVLNDATLLED